MTIQRMDHVGVVVDDLKAAIAFFVELGMEPDGGTTPVEGDWVDRVVGLDEVREEGGEVTVEIHGDDGVLQQRRQRGLVREPAPLHHPGVVGDDRAIVDVRHQLGEAGRPHRRAEDEQERVVA